MATVETTAVTQPAPVPSIPSMEGMMPNFAAAQPVSAATSSAEPVELDTEVRDVVNDSSDETTPVVKTTVGSVVPPVANDTPVIQATASTSADASDRRPLYEGDGAKIGEVEARDGETVEVRNDFKIVPYGKPGSPPKTLILCGPATRWYTRFFKQMEGLLKGEDGNYRVVPVKEGYDAVANGTSDEFLVLRGHFRPHYSHLKSDDGSKQPGWSFSIDQKDVLLKYVHLFVNGSLPPLQWVQKYPQRRQEQKQKRNQANAAGSSTKTYAQKVMQGVSVGSSKGGASAPSSKGGSYTVKVYWPRVGQNVHIRIGSGTLEYKVRFVDKSRGEVQIHQLGSTDLAILNHTTFLHWQVRGLMDEHKVRFV